MCLALSWETGMSRGEPWCRRISGGCWGNTSIHHQSSSDIPSTIRIVITALWPGPRGRWRRSPGRLIVIREGDRRCKLRRLTRELLPQASPARTERVGGHLSGRPAAVALTRTAGPVSRPDRRSHLPDHRHLRAPKRPHPGRSCLPGRRPLADHGHQTQAPAEITATVSQSPRPSSRWSGNSEEAQ